MNIEAINNTIALLEQAKPERLKMSSTAQNMVAYWSSNEMCTTAACVGGWVLMANAAMVSKPLPILRKMVVYYSDHELAKVLDIDNGMVQNLAYMTEVTHEQMTLACDRLANYCAIYLDRHMTISLFDRFPDEVRKHSAITVLTRLKLTGQVDWVGAIDEAITWYLAKQIAKPN